MQRVEINAVFEGVLVQELELRPVGHENIFVDAGIDIADVFRGQGQQDLLVRAIGIFARPAG